VRRVDALALEDVARQMLAAAGMEAGEARVVAQCLVEANLRGVDSHGVLRLPQYVDALRRGVINRSPQPRIVARRGAVALVDADGGYGYRPTFQAVSVAVDLARAIGVGVVGVRNSHHFGMAASYTLRAAEAGVIGFVTTTATPTLVPPGGARACVGNNPVSWAVPRRPPRPPLVLDMALGEVAPGKIRLAAEEGRSIPPGWAYDTSGRPTPDPQEALRSRMLAPVGNHKGYGLAVIMDVLAGVLTGSPFGLRSDSHGERQGAVGHLVLALDPGHFVGREQFYDMGDPSFGALGGAPPDARRGAGSGGPAVAGQVRSSAPPASAARPGPCGPGGHKEGSAERDAEQGEEGQGPEQGGARPVDGAAARHDRPGREAVPDDRVPAAGGRAGVHRPREREGHLDGIPVPSGAADKWRGGELLRVGAHDSPAPLRHAEGPERGALGLEPRGEHPLVDAGGDRESVRVQETDGRCHVGRAGSDEADEKAHPQARPVGGERPGGAGARRPPVRGRQAAHRVITSSVGALRESCPHPGRRSGGPAGCVV
jgi:ureidoglycolate dehydrogenase (NAD+)